MNTRNDFRTDEALWRPVFADLAFWATAGAVCAVISGPLGDLFGIATPWILIGGLTFFVGGLGLLYMLNRERPTRRQLVAAFAIGNLTLAPIAWITALFGWLPLTTTGNWGLAVVGDIALVLGIYQANAVRPARR